jgi:hypothetical protein
MVPAGPLAAIDTWIGWYEPYATSHDDLDKDRAIVTQVEQAALSLANFVRQLRDGSFEPPNAGLHGPRQK